MLIRRGNMNHGNIQWKNTVLEEQREFRKQDGGKICAAFLHSLTNVMADKKSIDTQVTFHLGGYVIGRADRQCLTNFHILQMGSVFDQGREYLLRHGNISCEKDAHPGFDYTNRLLSSRNPRLVNTIPVHQGLLWRAMSGGRVVHCAC